VAQPEIIAVKAKIISGGELFNCCLLIALRILLPFAHERNRKVFLGNADQVQIRHSGESRNPGKSTSWTPAYAGVTDLISASFINNSSAGKIGSAVLQHSQ
jgi:hypothetical protein